MTRLVATLLFVALAWPGDASAQSAPARAAGKTVTVGVVLDGPWDKNDQIRAIFVREIQSLTKGGFDVQFPESKQLVGDWTADAARGNLRALMADREVDLVLAIGVLAGNVLAGESSFAKPVLAPFVIDPALQGLPNKNGKSGVKNLSYLANPWTLATEIGIFREVAPFTRLAMMVNRSFFDSVDGLDARVQQAAKEAGVVVDIVKVGDSVDEALAALPAEAEAVYVAPLIQLSSEQFQALVAGLNGRKLPTFAQLGRIDVERGLLAGTRPLSDFARIGRRLAIDVQRILLGDDPGTFPVSLKLGQELVINMATARAIDVYPSWKVLTEAELVGGRDMRNRRQLSFSDTLKEALRANVDLKARRAEVRAGAAQVKETRSNLLPQFDASTLGRLIDSDTADNSLGSAPETRWTGSLALTQLLYSERAWSGFFIEQHLQTSRERDYDTSELDIARDVAIAYLGVLRAGTLERVQRDNLRVTRSNLELARTRVAVGAANRAEVFRWESQIASDRRSVISAAAQRNQAEIQLNRLLNRPTEEPFDTSEVSLEDPSLLTSNEQLFRLMGDPRTFRLFRQFMLEEAVAQSPELKSLDAAVLALAQNVKSNKRRFYRPVVALQAGLTYEFARGGAGAEPAEIPIPDVTIGQPPDLSWNVGVNVSIPIFEGGERFAAVARAEADLSRLQKERVVARQLVEQRIASVLHAAGASYAAIDLTRDQARAARENLELVKDAYGNGALPIIQLIDAQNQALVADQLAANAVYDFLVDYMEAQRAVGRFDVFLDDSERKDFFIRAVEYVSRARTGDK